MMPKSPAGHAQRGLKRVLAILPRAQRRKIKAILNDPAKSLLPSTEDIWGGRHELLAASGLGFLIPDPLLDEAILLQNHARAEDELFSRRVKDVKADPPGGQTITCEDCGYSNAVAAAFFTHLKTQVRCPECCHVQPLCAEDLVLTVEVPEFDGSPEVLAVRSG
jgi:hypothetical protein